MEHFKNKLTSYYPVTVHKMIMYRNKLLNDFYTDSDKTFFVQD